MPDFSLEQPSTQAGLERLHDAVAQLGDLVRDAARKSVALETRIEALPGPKDIAVAVEAELERTVREARDAIDARVGQLSGDLDALERRLVEVSEALVPLEGLRTEIATVADQSGSFEGIRAAIADAVERIGSVAPAPSAPAAQPSIETDAIVAALRGALDTTVATIRTDFEVLVRAEQEATERQIDSLGLRITNLSMSVSKALEDLVGHSARIDERAHLLEGENAAILEAVRAEVAAAVAAAGEEVRLRTEALGEHLGSRTSSAETTLAERVVAFESSVGERVAALEATLADQLRNLSATVGALPQDVSTTLGEINRTLVAAGDLNAVQTAVEAAAEHLRAEQASALDQIARSIEDVAPSVARALADVREALATNAQRTAEAIGTVRDEVASSVETVALAREDATTRGNDAIAAVREEVGAATQRTTGVLEELRAPLAQMADAAGAIERSRAELSAAIAALGEHLVQRTAGVKTSITDRAGRLEEQIGSLAGADDVAAAVENRIGSALSEAQRKADETADAARHDLSEITSNVNEIWIRVRTMGQGLEELRAASKEDAATMIALIEEMAQSEERSAARLAEAERRFVGAVRAIEHERDGVFIRTMDEFLERLPRRERSRMGKRLRALSFTRREQLEQAQAEIVEPLQPAAPVSLAEQYLEPPIPVSPPKRPSKPKARAKPKETPRAKQPPKQPEKKASKQRTPPKPRARRTRSESVEATLPPADVVELPSKSPETEAAAEIAPQPQNEPDQSV